jgi:hypothetical protein
MSAATATAPAARPAAIARVRQPARAALADAPAAQVTIEGALLQPAQLRITGTGLHTTVQLLVAQPGKLPPVCVLLRPAGGMAAYIAWRQQVHSYARGVLVRVQGHGLRAGNVNGNRALVLEHASHVALLQAPFDARAAAAGDGAA